MPKKEMWQVSTPRNLQSARPTKNIPFEDWKPYASDIQAWCSGPPAERRTAKAIVEALADCGFHVNENQFNDYKTKAGLRCPNSRTKNKAANVQPSYVAQSDGRKPAKEEFKPARSDGESSFDEMEIVESESSDAERVDGEHDEVSAYGTSSETRDAFGMGRLHLSEASPEEGVDVMLEISSIDRSQGSSQTSIAWQQKSYLSQTVQEQRFAPADSRPNLEVTLLSFARISGPSSEASSHRGRTLDWTSISCFTKKSEMEAASLSSYGLSSRSSATTQYQRSVKGADRWVYPGDSTRWKSLVKVNHVLDVFCQDADSAEDDFSLKVDRLRKDTRRLVVVKIVQDAFWGVPVRTYRGTGVPAMSSESQISAHAVLYAHGTLPTLMPNEPRLSKRSIAIKCASRSRPLDPASRINFSRPCLMAPASVISKVGKIQRSSASYVECYWHEHLQPKLPII